MHFPNRNSNIGEKIPVLKAPASGRVTQVTQVTRCSNASNALQ